MAYSDIRTLNWIFDLACSSIGIVAFISLFGWLFQPTSISSALTEKEQLDRQAKNDKRQIIQRFFSFVILILLLCLAVIKYSGELSIEDVFNGQYKYVGQTINSKADGKGKQYTLHDTLIYEGDFITNMYDGNGKLYSIVDEEGEETNRLLYDGEFKSGSFHGTGKKYFAAMEDVDDQGKDSPFLMYEGEFKKGLYEGHGVRYYTTKKPDVEVAKMSNDYYITGIYEGSWSAGNRNGNGTHTLYDADGKIIERYSGNFLDDSYNGVGVWEFIDKSDGHYGQVIYHGTVVNGRCTGEGVFYDSSGNVISTKDENGKGEEELKIEYPYPIENIWN